MNNVMQTVGFGLGLREQHHKHILKHLPKIDWFEIISENYMDSDGPQKQELERIRTHYPIAMHGVGMSIGTIDPLDSDYFKKLQALIDWLDPLWVSDHVCWTGVAHKNTHDLLPIPYTDASLAHLIERIDAVQTALKRPLVLENPSTYLEFKNSTITEADFLAQMVKRSGCELLLDANNIYVSCFNHRLDTQAYVDALPLDAVRSMHLAGHDHQGTHIVDTHDDYVSDDVWTLYHYILQKAGRVPNTMIEWDADIPSFEVYAAELDKAKKIANTHEDAPKLPNFSNGDTVPYLSNEEFSYADELARLQDAILLAAHEGHRPEDWIIPKPDFSAKDQVSVYVMAYRFRLYDAVAEEYPVLKHCLGAAAFDKLLKDMVNTVQSTHYNLATYVSALPEFLVRHPCHTAFSGALAELEKSIFLTYHKPESGVMSEVDFKQHTPEEIAALTFAQPPEVTLHTFEYPVNAYYSAVVNESAPEIPELQKTWVAVYRGGTNVWRSDLDAEEHAALTTIYSGVPLGEVLADAAPEKIPLWLGNWLQSGFLAIQSHNKREHSLV